MLHRTAGSADSRSIEQLVERLDHPPQDGRADGHQIGDAGRAVEAGQVVGEVLEHEAQQERVALRGIALHERGRQLSEVAIATAVPAAGDDVGRAQPGRLHQPQEHEALSRV